MKTITFATLLFNHYSGNRGFILTIEKQKKYYELPINKTKNNPLEDMYFRQHSIPEDRVLEGIKKSTFCSIDALRSEYDAFKILVDAFCSLKFNKKHPTLRIDGRWRKLKQDEVLFNFVRERDIFLKEKNEYDKLILRKWQIVQKNELFKVLSPLISWERKCMLNYIMPTFEELFGDLELLNNL